MEQRLEEKDYNILYSGKTIDSDNARYKYISSFDIDNEDDYVEALVHDSEQNFIQSVIVDKSDYTYGEIEGKPEIKLNTGTILRKLGYDRGRYVVKYNFLRKKAGSYETILVDENSDRYVGDYHVMPDGTIMDGVSHENSTGKILQVKELKYFIQEISPSRNEIRIVPQKIKDTKYINSFVNLQTRNNEYAFKGDVTLYNSPANQPNSALSKLVTISQGENLKKNMEGGTFYINNAFIEQIIPPTPPPGEGNLFEEVNTVDTDPLVIASRFVVLDETTTFYASGDKSLDFIYKQITNNGANKNVTVNDNLPVEDNFNFQNQKIIKNVIGAKRDGDNIFDKITKFRRPQEGQPIIVTLGSVSSRPQNVTFEYEWTIFGYDRNRYGEGSNQEHRYDPISGRNGGVGTVIIQGETVGSLTATGADKKQITIEIYGGDVRLGVSLRISRPAADLESSVAIPHAIFVE
tara:strand:- start:2241 stop:3629 length:1389 start_codon:yes stop_codon:yes gene_type:complete